MKFEEEILNYFPCNIYNLLKKENNQDVKKYIQEIRIRCNRPIILKIRNEDKIIDYKINQYELLPFMVPYLIGSYIEDNYKLDVSIKWPNDVYVNNKKVCGILLESRIPEYIVIGIGMGEGDAKADIWSCDFSYEYVKINGEYHT